MTRPPSTVMPPNFLDGNGPADRRASGAAKDAGKEFYRLRCSCSATHVHKLPFAHLGYCQTIRLTQPLVEHARGNVNNSSGGPMLPPTKIVALLALSALPMLGGCGTYVPNIQE